MRTVIGVTLVLLLLLAGAASAAASSGQAADGACVGQFTARMAQIEGLRPVGRSVVSRAAHESGYGTEQSYIATRCDTELLIKRYPI